MVLRCHSFLSRRCAVVLAGVLCLGVMHEAHAQSLAAAARAAEAQRKTTGTVSKVYTNESLGAVPPAPPAAASPSAAEGTVAVPPSQSGAPAEDDKGKEPPKDEAYWRERVKSERDALARAETFAAALQSQINGLYGEFTACDAPTQCNDISERRQKSLAELDRVKKEVEDHTKGVTAIQEEARRAGVPAGWVR